MVNYVNFKCDCPECGKPVTDFQTKDGDFSASRLEPWTVGKFYSMCNDCRLWIEYSTDSAVSDSYIMEGLEAVKLLRRIESRYSVDHYGIPEDLEADIDSFLEKTKYPKDDSWLSTYNLKTEKLPPVKTYKKE